MYAGFPPMLTLTPSRMMGSFPFTMDLLQSSVTVASDVPVMVTHEFATTPAWKLAPLTTPFAPMAGGAGGGGSTTSCENLGLSAVAHCGRLPLATQSLGSRMVVQL